MINFYVGRCTNCGRAIRSDDKRFYARILFDDGKRERDYILCNNCCVELTAVKGGENGAKNS